MVVWCVCWVSVGVVESEFVLEPFVVLWGPGVRCPGWIWCVQVRCGSGRVCLDFRSGWVKSWWERWRNTSFGVVVVSLHDCLVVVVPLLIFSVSFLRAGAYAAFPTAWVGEVCFFGFVRWWWFCDNSSF